jgi:hypothetical protein
MGIEIEFNPDLCLRKFSDFEFGKRNENECLPKLLEVGKEYNFLKLNQRNFYFGEMFMPLRETRGGGVLSMPVAVIEIIEATHFKKEGKVWTKGIYKVLKILKQDEIYFDGFELLGTTFKNK